MSQPNKSKDQHTPLPVPELPPRVILDLATKCNLRCGMCPVWGSDDEDAKQQVMEIVNRISKLQAFNAGPLAVSPLIESLTPLVLNIARYNKMRDVGILFR